MRCEEVQEYLAERLAGSLSDRLSGTVHAYVRTHMLSCPDCCEELEDFEGMQSVLGSIPVEPCDSKAMRARFDLLTGARDTKLPSSPVTRPSPPLPLTRTPGVVFSILVAGAVIVAAVFAVRQTWKWIDADNVALKEPAQDSSPGAAPAGAGAMSGQIRTENGELPHRVRVALIAVPEPGSSAQPDPRVAEEIVVESNDEGRYRMDNIPAGRYYVLASSIESPTYYPGSSDVAGAKIVSILPGANLEGIDFSRIESARRPTPPAFVSEMSRVSGRVLLEDGRVVSEPLPLGEIALTPGAASSISSSTILKVDGNGNFSRSVEAADYRLRVAVFSQNYIIRSITAGPTDLLLNNLEVRGAPVTVEIRVAPRGNTSGGRVYGTVVDASGNAASEADHVLLCCFPNGPSERISTPVHSDGTFEFGGIPSGQYTAELRGRRYLAVANPSLAVSPGGVSGLKLFSTARLIPTDVTVRLDTGDRLPYKPDTSIVFNGSNGLRVAASPFVGNLFRAFLPANGTFTLNVSNTAAGYTVQSVVDDRMTDLMHGGLFKTPFNQAGPSHIVVTLSKN